MPPAQAAADPGLLSRTTQRSLVLFRGFQDSNRSILNFSSTR